MTMETETLPVTVASNDIGDIEAELSKARDTIRGIEDNFRTISGGRSVLEFSGRGRGRGRGAFRGAVQPPPGSVANRRFVAVDGGEDRFANRAPIGGPRGGAMGRGGAMRGRMGSSIGAGSRLLQSAVVQATRVDDKSRDDAIQDIKSTEEKTGIKTRNRRMFQNVLLGTLNQFKKETTNRFAEQERRQREVEEKLNAQKSAERQQMETEKRELVREHRQKQFEIRRLQRKAVLITAVNNWEAHMRRLQGFIQTSAQPPIFYLPAKHSIRTLELQKKSAKRLDELISMRREKLTEELEAPSRRQMNNANNEEGKDNNMENGEGGDSAAPSNPKRRKMNSDAESDDDSSESEHGGESGDESEGHSGEKKGEEGEAMDTGGETTAEGVSGETAATTTDAATEETAVVVNGTSADNTTESQQESTTTKETLAAQQELETETVTKENNENSSSPSSKAAPADAETS